MLNSLDNHFQQCNQDCSYELVICLLSSSHLGCCQYLELLNIVYNGVKICSLTSLSSHGDIWSNSGGLSCMRLPSSFKLTSDITRISSHLSSSDPMTNCFELDKLSIIFIVNTEEKNLFRTSAATESSVTV